MITYTPEGTHHTYTETDRHYHPRSESYTGADSILTAQRNGWRLVNIAYRADHQLRGGRFTTLYHFKLVRQGETMLMPVVSNPFVTKMLESRHIIVRPYPSQATAIQADVMRDPALSI